MLLVDVSIGVANELTHRSVLLAEAVGPTAESPTGTTPSLIQGVVTRASASRSVSVGGILCKTIVIFVSGVKFIQLCDDVFVGAFLAVFAEASVGCLIQHKVLSLYED